MSGYSSGAAQRSGHDPQRARKMSRASLDKASAAGAIELVSIGLASEASSVRMTSLQPAAPLGASAESAFSVNSRPTRCDCRSSRPDPRAGGGGVTGWGLAAKVWLVTAAPAASIAEKSNANDIATLTGAIENARLCDRQPLGWASLSCRACSDAIATALRSAAASVSETARRLASSAARSRLLAKTSTGQPMRSINSTKAACRIPSRKNRVIGSRLDISRPYLNRAAYRYAARVAEGCGCTLAQAIANPVRPVPGTVVIPPREPDAVVRAPEHIRRAREVIGSVAKRIGHGGNMPPRTFAVAPNNIVLFGGSE